MDSFWHSSLQLAIKLATDPVTGYPQIGQGCAYLVGGIFGLSVLAFIVSTNMYSKKCRKEEMEKINEAFRSLEMIDGYEISRESSPFTAELSEWHTPPTVNRVLLKTINGRDYRIIDLLVLEEGSSYDGLAENLAGKRAKKGNKKALIERYFTYLDVKFEMPLSGVLKLKPKHNLECFTPDTGNEDEELFAEDTEFKKRYMVKSTEMKSADIENLLTSVVRKNLVTRATTYPVNSDIRWIILAKNELLLECCRIRSSEDLRKLVAFAEQLLDRIQGIAPPTAEGIIEEKSTQKDGNNGNGGNQTKAEGENGRTKLVESPAETDSTGTSPEKTEGETAVNQEAPPEKKE